MACDSNSSELDRSLSFTSDVHHNVSDLSDIPTNNTSQHTIHPQFSYPPSLTNPHRASSSHPLSLTEPEQTHRPPSCFGYLKSIGVRVLASIRSSHTSSSSSIPLLRLRRANTHIIPLYPSSTQTVTQFPPSQKMETILPRRLEAVVTRFRPLSSSKSFLNLSDGGVTLPLLSPPEPEHYSFFEDLPKSHSMPSSNQFYTRTIIPLVRKIRSQISTLFRKQSSGLHSGFVPEPSYHYTQSCNDLMCIGDSCITYQANLHQGTHRPSLANEGICDSERDLQHRSRGTLSGIMITTSTMMPNLIRTDTQAGALPLACHYSPNSDLRSKHQHSCFALKHSSLSNSSRHSPSCENPMISASQTEYDLPSGVQIRQVDNSYPVLGDGTPGRDSFQERDIKAFALDRSLIPEDAIIYSKSTLNQTAGCSNRLYESPADTSSSSTYDILTLHTSDFGIHPSPPGRSYQSSNEYYYPTSTWAPWPGTSSQEASSTSRDSCITDITISDFPLPPPSVSGLPLGYRVGLSHDESLLA